MQKITKEEVILLMAQLRSQGYSQEELGVKLGKTQQTIWAWSSKATKRVPYLSDYNVLKGMLK